MTMRGRLRITLAALALGVAGLAHAADIRLHTAWMRPAAEGEDASAYVDIESDTPLTLTGASTTLARKVEIVVVRKTDGLDPGKVVRTLPVAAGTTRLAYKGNHLRLVGMRDTMANGRLVPVTLHFRDRAGKRYDATADVQVRGLLAPHAPPHG
jgi:copper(I)-binding protein